jgi:uncharacterized protein
MSEGDGYIHGVPCWVDTNQPHPAAATLPFYGGLFGWEFEDGMPEGSGSHYFMFMARIRGGQVAAVSSVPEGSPPMAVWKRTSGWTTPTSRPRRWSMPAAPCWPSP